FQAEDGIRDLIVTGVQTCALPIWRGGGRREALSRRHRGQRARTPRARVHGAARAAQHGRDLRRGCRRLTAEAAAAARPFAAGMRSEERRVGKECRWRWGPWMEREQ